MKNLNTCRNAYKSVFLPRHTHCIIVYTVLDSDSCEKKNIAIEKTVHAVNGNKNISGFCLKLLNDL